MKKINKYAVIIILLAITAAFLGCREYNDPFNRIKRTGIIRVGMTGDYLPMSFFNESTGTYTGFDVELVETLADELGVKIEYVKTTWPTLMEDTLNRKFDLAICGITIMEDRKQQALMSEGYLGNGKTILIRKEDEEKYKTLEDINKKEVVVMENPGGTNERFVRSNLPNVTLIIHDKNAKIPHLIAEGEADVMITEILEAGYYVQMDDRLAAPLINEPFTSGELGILMPKGYDKLLKYTDEFIEEGKASGFIDMLANKYIYH
ncbi:MAG: transporter substrate-binding domain-containing protein [Erysipelotrichaceae bacterium]|nr:transporter substrate-binding domain-containing protein [Erysipelotrichaceae bacterium]